MDSLKTKNEALEAQIRETQEKYRKELEELQVRNQVTYNHALAKVKSEKEI